MLESLLRVLQNYSSCCNGTEYPLQPFLLLYTFLSRFLYSVLKVQILPSFNGLGGLNVAMST